MILFEINGASIDASFWPFDRLANSVNTRVGAFVA